jgi:hypothetical protein
VLRDFTSPENDDPSLSDRTTGIFDVWAPLSASVITTLATGNPRPVRGLPKKGGRGGGGMDPFGALLR